VQDLTENLNKHQEDNESDDEAVAGKVLAHVILAKTVRQ
jgi:hypothetical protein